MAILDTRARRLDEWRLSASVLPEPIAVRTPSAWEDYGVPRTFEGPCEYRCAFTATPERGKRYWLRCDGASYAVQGFLNETPIGDHRGIWDGFSWDITDALHDGENHLRLQVTKNGGATYPVPQVLSGFLPYVSATFGGLWQPVYLFETGAAWLTDLSVRGAADGETTIQGELGGATPAQLRLSIYDPQGIRAYTTHFEVGERWEHSLILTPAQVWHPSDPRLYRLVVEVFHEGALSHTVETHFGLRTVGVDGATILLNGKPFYPRGVLHWGWYLHTHAPNPELVLAARELKAVQLCGFNLLKACLWVPPREYLSLCDRLGMAVWLELPLWLPQMDAEQIAQAQREYEAIVRQTRNHPSILLWTLGCELSTRFPSEALGALYGVVKRLTGSPLVRDNSGGGECYGGALQEYADFADYHLYSDAHFARAAFRAFLDAPRAPAPWLQGEFADHDTQRDFLTLRQTTPRPQLWWLERDPEVNPQGVRWFYETPFVEERMQQAGVWDALPELVRASRHEMLAYHKLVLETMRSLPNTSGYVVTGLKDTPIATAGILDEHSELKVSPESYTDFNADTVLLLDWHRRRDWIAGGDRPAHPDPYNHFGGRAVYPQIIVSHFGTPITAQTLRWRLTRLSDRCDAVQSGEADIHTTLRAGVAWLTHLKVDLPTVENSERLLFELELLSSEGETIAANRWRWGVYPPPDWASLGNLVVYDPAETLWGLPHELRRAPANGDALDADALMLTTRLESSQVEAVRRGGAALWLVSAPSPALKCERVPFWREAAHRFLDHPLWNWLPRPEYLDERLFAFSTDLALQATAFEGCAIRPIWQRVDTRTGYTHCYLGEVALGAGKLLITTLHFAGHHGETPITLRYHPAGQYWLWAMLRYLASR